MAKDHGPRIKDDTLYEKLLKRGNSKGKAARIANAHAAGTLEHNSVHLDDRPVKQLRDEAARIGIAGRSKMKKAELEQAIRNGT